MGQVLLKCENLQRTGSFKFRGACYAVARLSAGQLARGVIAFSSGNHALALASAAGPGTRLIGVETTAGDKNRRSLRAGERVRIPVPRTIADGVTGEIPGELTFPLIRRHVHEVLVVDDDEIRAAMALLFGEMQLVVEPSGALAAAAVLAGKVDALGGRVGVVLSGGNVDLNRLHLLLRPESVESSS